MRGLDGVTRHVPESGKSRTAARLALQDERRILRGERAEVLRPESRFRDAVTICLGKVTARLEDSIADVYSRRSWSRCTRRASWPLSSG